MFCALLANILFVVAGFHGQVLETYTADKALMLRPSLAMKDADRVKLAHSVLYGVARTSSNASPKYHR